MPVRFEKQPIEVRELQETYRSFFNESMKYTSKLIKKFGYKQHGVGWIWKH